jgi:hypothetical protein
MNPRTRGAKPAWVQLYEARRQAVEVNVRTPGRPSAQIPRHKVGLTLSQGEIRDLASWQDRFSGLLRRKVSTGETVGILARICTARLERLPSEPPFEDLGELVETMVGEL